MKFAKPFAIASVIAVAGTSAFAGGLDTAAETPPLIIPPEEPGSSASLPVGSIGSLGGAAPALIALAVLGAAVAASDSSGGS